MLRSSFPSGLRAQVLRFIAPAHYEHSLPNALVLNGEPSLVLHASSESRDLLKDLGYKQTIQIECNTPEHLLGVLRQLSFREGTPGSRNFGLLRLINETNSRPTTLTPPSSDCANNLAFVLVEYLPEPPEDFYALANSLGRKIKVMTIIVDCKRICLEWISTQLWSTHLLPKSWSTLGPVKYFWSCCRENVQDALFEFNKLEFLGMKHRLTIQRAQKLIAPSQSFRVSTLLRALREQNILALMVMMKDLKQHHYSDSFTKSVLEVLLVLRNFLKPHTNLLVSKDCAEIFAYINTAILLTSRTLMTGCDENFVWVSVLCISVIFTLRAQDLIVCG